MTLKVGAVQKIRYSKFEKIGEMDCCSTSERYIVPTFLPTENIKAIDVTNLSDDERATLIEQLNEYSEYVGTQRKAMFSFEDWVEHTTNYERSVKWRTFKQSQVDLLV